MTFPTNLPAFSPTTDTLIALAVVATTVVGSMIGHARTKLVMMSMFVGAGVASFAIPLLHNFIGHPGGLLALINLKVLALAVCIGVLGFTDSNAYHRAVRSSAVLNLVTSALTGLLLVTIFLSLLDPGALAATKDSSTLAMAIYDTRIFWYLGAPLLLMFGGLIHGKRH